MFSTDSFVHLGDDYGVCFRLRSIPRKFKCWMCCIKLKGSVDTLESFFSALNRFSGGDLGAAVDVFAAPLEALPRHR